MGWIYLITNTVTGHRYVGQTSRTVTARWKQHVSDALHKPNKMTLMGRAIRKYGAESFSVETIGQFTNCLGEAEKLFIAELNTFAPNGYNLTQGGDGGMVGYKHTPLAIAKIAASSREKKPNLGRIFPEEWKEAIRRGCKGKNTRTGPCPAGHTDFWTDPDGYRRCKDCKRIQNAKWREQQNERRQSTGTVLDGQHIEA